MDLVIDQVGLLKCARYAAPPNSFSYCGPDKQVNLKSYLATQTADLGLTEIIKDFGTLYPYLKLIAQENKISNPFDPKVVEAYWLGNQLLAKVKLRAFANHIVDDLNLKKKAKTGQINPLMEKLEEGVPHHNFHVMNVFIRTGHQAIKHTLKTMDECRISWGVVTKNSKFKNKIGKQNTVITILTEPLIYTKEKLVLGNSVEKSVTAEFGNYQEGDIVSFHWGQICERITGIEARRLEYYTKQAINIANRSVSQFIS